MGPGPHLPANSRSLGSPRWVGRRPPSRREDIVSTTIRPLTFVLALLASLLLMLPARAHAANDQLTGTALFKAGCPDAPSPYDDYAPLVMSGSLDGCWYTNVETDLTTPGGVYHE